MRFWMLLLSFGYSTVFADTMANYMHIASTIPKMEIKADAASQAWARSARNVLLITHESIIETMMVANQQATQNGQPLFCLPAGSSLSPTMLQGMLMQQAKEPNQSSSMTVSLAAWQAVLKQYPCQQPTKNNLAKNIPVMTHQQSLG